MAKNNLIHIVCFGEEIGRLGFDENEHKSFFQYHPEFLKSDNFRNLFPQTGTIKRVPQTQVFSQFNTETFRGLPPQIADSLPDMFGNIIFKTWLEANHLAGDFTADRSGGSGDKYGLVFELMLDVVEVELNGVALQ